MLKKQKTLRTKEELSKEELEELYNKLSIDLKFEILEFYSYNIYYIGNFERFNIDKFPVKNFYGRFKLDTMKTIFLLFLKVRFIWYPSALKDGLTMVTVNDPIKSILPKDVRYIYIWDKPFPIIQNTAIALLKDSGHFKELRKLDIYPSEFWKKTFSKINVKNIEKNLEELTLHCRLKINLEKFFSFNWTFKKLKKITIFFTEPELGIISPLKTEFKSLKKIEILSDTPRLIHRVSYFSAFPPNLTYLELPAVDKSQFKFDGFKKLKTLHLSLDSSLSYSQIEELSNLKYLETLIIGDIFKPFQIPIIILNQNIMKLFLTVDNLKILNLYNIDISNISLESFKPPFKKKKLKPKTIIIKVIIYRENLINFYTKLNKLVNLEIIINLSATVMYNRKTIYSKHRIVTIPFSEFKIINHFLIREDSQISHLKFVYLKHNKTYKFSTYEPLKSILSTVESIEIMKKIVLRYLPKKIY